MKYLTELHCHSSPSSPCASRKVEEVAEAYIAAGYRTLVLTNHYHGKNFDSPNKSFEEQMEHYMADYHQLKEYAKGRLNIILGCEINVHDDPNDYLLFGVTEELLWNYPRLNLLKMKDLSPFFHKNGVFIVQAHPFRDGMKICSPELLDGMEIFNGANTKNSRNDIAEIWARKHGLIPTSGSDYHNVTQQICAGIYTEEEIVTSEQLVSVLRSRNYILRRSGDNAILENLSDIPATL